jgi:hypothetical protein
MNRDPQIILQGLCVLTAKFVSKELMSRGAPATVFFWSDLYISKISFFDRVK